VAAGVAIFVTWRVAIANNRAAHNAWLRQKRADAYLSLIAAINMRASRRNRADVTVASQTLPDVTLFGSQEVRAAFDVAKELDRLWAEAQVRAADTPTQQRSDELQAAKDALTVAENAVLDRIRAEVEDMDLARK